MRYERHITILGLGGAKCDGCGTELDPLSRALSTSVPGETFDVELLCRDCARKRLEAEKEGR